MKSISYENTKDAVYDYHDPLYKDPKSVERELNRTFDLCNGCRMCFKYCPSFPTLFKAMDRTEANVFELKKEEKEQVIDECYQCRVCYIVCPYTETDKHSYKIDFPALILRAKILAPPPWWSMKRLRSQLLGNPDLLGMMSSGFLSFFINLSMKIRLLRLVLHLIPGIHRDKRMPQFSRETFSRWFKRHKKTQSKTQGKIESKVPSTAHIPASKAVLFSTCFVNYNNPQIGKDAVEVFEKNHVELEHPPMVCCGMPFLEGGNIPAAVKKMKYNVLSLLPYVRKGYKILAINPSCSLALKNEYKRFLPPGEWKEQGAEIAASSMDLHEFLFSLHREGRFNRDFQSTPGKIAYHVPCHLRAQNIGFRSRDILRLIPGSQPLPTPECCGHDGTWAMKREYFQMSLQAGKRSFEALASKNADCTVTDCPLAAVQLEQGMGLSELPSHPIQVLARAYRLPSEGGFSNSVPNEKNQNGS